MISVVEFKNRQAWSEARTTIGGSEAAALIGKSPYMSNTELWEIKTGRKQQKDLGENDLVQYGHDAEPIIRKLFELDHPEFKVSYKPNAIYRNDLYPFAHASVDGLLIDKETGSLGILEIKTATLNSATQGAKWSDANVPVNYLIQVLWYMAILNADFAIICAQLKNVRWRGEEAKVMIEKRVDRSDYASDITYLMMQARQFWDYVDSDTRPPMILDI